MESKSEPNRGEKDEKKLAVVAGWEVAEQGQSPRVVIYSWKALEGVSDNDWGYYVPPESKLTFGELGRLQKEPVKGHHDREAQEALGRHPSADSKSQ